MRTLTKAEEEVMQVLWKQGPSFVKEILPHLPEKAAYTTISTIVRILEEKGFVTHQSFGKAHRYEPLITKQQYRKQRFKDFFQQYFDGSHTQLASFFAKEKALEEDELRQFLDELQSDD